MRTISTSSLAKAAPLLAAAFFLGLIAFRSHRTIELACAIDEQVPHTIASDVTRLRQILELREKLLGLLFLLRSQMLPGFHAVENSLLPI